MLLARCEHFMRCQDESLSRILSEKSISFLFSERFSSDFRGGLHFYVVRREMRLMFPAVNGSRIKSDPDEEKESSSYHAQTYFALSVSHGHFIWICNMLWVIILTASL